MKAESIRNLLKLSSVIVLAAAFATGCIAQTSTGTEDPASGEQALVTTGAAHAPTVEAVPQGHIKPPVAVEHSQFTTSTVIKGADLEMVNPPTSDPGGAVKDDGDGREPDPHPWHARVQMFAR